MGDAFHREGDAGKLYLESVRGQSSAAGRIGDIADQVSSSLNLCASTGLAFYVTLAAVLAKFIIGVTAALGALMTGVGAPVAGGIFLEEAGFNATVIGAAITAALAVLYTQFQEMDSIRSQARDVKDYPGPPIGTWPKGTA